MRMGVSSRETDTGAAVGPVGSEGCADACRGLLISCANAFGAILRRG